MTRTSHNSGFTLVELLLAVSLGSAVVAGMLQLFSQGMRSYRTTQSLLELEDRAAFALRELSSDLRLAGYTQTPGGSLPNLPVNARCSGRDVSAWADPSTNVIEARADSAGLPCPAAGAPVSGSDSISIRHLDPYLPDAVWQANAWYVDTRSSENGLAALRRQTLLPNGMVQNQEIMPGVTRMQIELGRDTDGDGRIDSFARPDTPTLGAILAVRVELTLQSAANSSSVDPNLQLSVRRLIALRNALARSTVSHDADAARPG